MSDDRRLLRVQDLVVTHTATASAAAAAVREFHRSRRLLIHKAGNVSVHRSMSCQVPSFEEGSVT